MRKNPQMPFDVVHSLPLFFPDDYYQHILKYSNDEILRAE